MNIIIKNFKRNITQKVKGGTEERRTQTSEREQKQGKEKSKRQ